MKTKFIWMIILLAVLVFPQHSFAHSHLETSLPFDGEVITEQITEIELSFDGGIEDVSTVQIIDENGDEIKLNDISITSPELRATVEEPLQNGRYVVNWQVLSADTHMMKGTFSFTVDLAEEMTSDISEAVVTEENDDLTPLEEEADENKEVSEEQAEHKSQLQSEEERGKWFMIPIAIIGVLVIIVIILRSEKKQ